MTEDNTMDLVALMGLKHGFKMVILSAAYGPEYAVTRGHTASSSDVERAAQMWNVQIEQEMAKRRPTNKGA